MKACHGCTAWSLKTKKNIWHAYIFCALVNLFINDSKPHSSGFSSRKSQSLIKSSEKDHSFYETELDWH